MKRGKKRSAKKAGSKKPARGKTTKRKGSPKRSTRRASPLPDLSAEFLYEFEELVSQQETDEAERIKQLTEEGREYFGTYDEIDTEEVQDVRRWSIRDYMDELNKQGFKVSLNYGDMEAGYEPGTESEMNADLFLTELESEFFERFREIEDEMSEDEAKGLGSPDLIYRVVLNHENNTARVVVDRGIFTHEGMIKGMPIKTIFKNNLL